MKFLNNVDFARNQLLNVQIQNLATPPTGLTAANIGLIYYHTGDKALYVWDGTGWQNTTSAGTILSVSGTAPVTASTNSGAVTISMAAATGSVDGYLTAANWTTFNNKEGAIAAGTELQYYRGDKTWQTLNATSVGLGSVTNNAQVKKRASSTSGYIPTWDGTTGDALNNGFAVETTLTGATTAIPRADAVKNYVDGLLAANDAMVFKGTIGIGGTLTTAAFNSLATYNTGWTYKVITAGTHKGKVTEIGDMLIALVTRAGSGQLDTDWAVVQANIDGAVTGPASAVNNNFAAFDQTTGKLIKDSGANSSSFRSSAWLPPNDHVRQHAIDSGDDHGTMTAGRIVGRITNNGTPQQLTAAEVRTLLNVADGATANAGTVTSVGGTGTVSGLTLSGTVTTTGNLTLGGTLSVTASNFSSQTANTFLAAPNGSAGVPTFRAILAADIPTLDQNTTGTAANVTGIVAVGNGGTGQTTYTNGQLLIGNSTGNTLTKATLTQGTGITISNSAGGITVTNSAPNATHTGDVTGSAALTIAANAVTNAKAAQMATMTIKGNNTGALANAIDLTTTQVRTMLNVANGATANVAASVAPLIDGTAAVGTSANYARQDHVHPISTRKFAASVGDGIETSFVVPHNFATKDLAVSIRENAGSFSEVYTTVEYTSDNTITVKFSAIPTTNQYRVIVVG